MKNALINEKFFRNKVVLITGGTGSFGKTMLEQLAKIGCLSEIRILSRDEKKQDDLRKLHNNQKIKFFIGDVRDKSSVREAVLGSDLIFHAAALKQVPSCEFFPIEAVKTNILGTENILDEAIRHKVEAVICLSTDKAVYPINAMGISKAMMEKLVMAKSRTSGKTRLIVTRYGNVIGSRGSVIPLFFNQIAKAQPLTITNPDMTRFMMTLNEAVELVLYAFEHGINGDLFVKKSPACNINNLAKGILSYCSLSDYPIKIIGTRHGEKLYETLLSNEEFLFHEDCGEFYRVFSDTRDLNYDAFTQLGDAESNLTREFNSHNTKQLTEIEIIKIIRDFDKGN